MIAPGLVAIEAEMARQHADALDSVAAAKPVVAIIATSIRKTGRLLLLGMGGSHWVNRTAARAYRELGVDASAEVVSDMLGVLPSAMPRTVLIVSQSGQSGEIVRYLREEAGADERFGLTLDAASPLGRSVPCLIGSGGPERAFAATRSLLISHALHLAVLASLGLDPIEALAALAEPEMVEIEAALDALAACLTFVVSGRGLLAGVAEGGALCLMELARCSALGFEAGQLRHGPMEALTSQTGVIILRGAKSADLDAALAADCRLAGCPVVVLDGSGSKPVRGVHTLSVGPSDGMAAVFDMLPTLQRLLVEVAAARVADVGTPIRSNKITVTP
ncbi:SIS domain-containing protein [Lichenihabitans psoromatis]|uniref:SIS domain-containing protein n=1 Tax=Lichenihabitans psoromatis TaxID=2528642 RepID=UPI001036ACDB|nr:SIS domain-containing protein [Lichenihabitans psoromatis]